MSFFPCPALGYFEHLVLDLFNLQSPCQCRHPFHRVSTIDPRSQYWLHAYLNRILAIIPLSSWFSR